MSSQFCKSCRFWKDDEHQVSITYPGDPVLGICRRFPPVSTLTDHADIEWDECSMDAMKDGTYFPASHNYWDQPHVLEGDWCGEYQERQEVAE